MVFAAYPPMNTTVNQLAKSRIQSQIRRRTNEASQLRQKIEMLQKELSDNDSIVANLRKLLQRGIRKRAGIFCEMQQWMEWFRGTKLLGVYSCFFATGIVCLTNWPAQLDIEKSADGIKLTNKNHKSASTHKLDGNSQQGTCQVTSVASLSISLKVCLETIESDIGRSCNSSSQDTDDSASSGDVEDRKDGVEQTPMSDTFGMALLTNEGTKITNFPTSTRSLRQISSASPMQASSPWSPIGDYQQRLMEVSLMDLGPSASSSHTPGSLPSSRSYCINHQRPLNKRRDSCFSEKPRLISFWDDYPSAATDDSSCLRTQSSSKRRSRETESPKFRFTDESQGPEDQYFRSIELNDVAGVQSMLDVGVPIECRNGQSNTGLILAAMNGLCEIVSCFLSAGAAGQVNLSNDDGFTALQYAAKLGDKEIVRCLLTNRADVDARNKFHQTPVMLAARNGHSEVTEMLLVAGASVERRDRGGRNALMMAARNGRVATVEVLLKTKAKVNMVDRRGKTALTLMAEHACPRSIRGMELLLDYGAHSRADDDDGLCALTYLGRRVKSGLVPLDSTVRSIAERMKRSMQ